MLWQTVPEGLCLKCLTGDADQVLDHLDRVLRYICRSCGAEWGPPDVTMIMRTTVSHQCYNARLLKS